MTTELYGPVLGSVVTINAPRRECHGKTGQIISLLLSTNETMVQLADGTRYIVPWDEVVDD
jgi:hypothetical protein